MQGSSSSGPRAWSLFADTRRPEEEEEEEKPLFSLDLLVRSTGLEALIESAEGRESRVSGRVVCEWPGRWGGLKRGGRCDTRHDRQAVRIVIHRHQGCQIFSSNSFATDVEELFTHDRT